MVYDHLICTGQFIRISMTFVEGPIIAECEEKRNCDPRRGSNNFRPLLPHPFFSIDLMNCVFSFTLNFTIADTSFSGIGSSRGNCIAPLLVL